MLIIIHLAVFLALCKIKSLIRETIQLCLEADKGLINLCINSASVIV